MEVNCGIAYGYTAFLTVNYIKTWKSQKSKKNNLQTDGESLNQSCWNTWTCIDDFHVALALGGCFSATVVFVLNSLWEVGVCVWGGLTPSLPWCYLKTTNKCAQFETLKLFLSYFLHFHVKGFSSKHIALNRDVTGAENVLSAGASVHLSAWKLYRRGQWRG